MKLKTFFILFFLALCIPASLHAAESLYVSPVRVHLSPGEKTEVLRVRNDGEKKVTLQVECFSWTYDEKGTDKFAEAEKQLVFFPKLVIIKPGEERTIKLGYNGQWPKKEKSFRVFVEEIPVIEPGRTGLMLARRFSIPIFVQPSNRRPGRKVRIESLKIAEDKIKVRMINEGDTYYFVEKIKASFRDGSGAEKMNNEIAGWYVLPGLPRDFEIPARGLDCSQVRELLVSAEDDDRDPPAEAALKVDESVCADLKNIGEKSAESNESMVSVK